MFDYDALDADTRDRLSIRARGLRPQMYRVADEADEDGEGCSED